MNPQSLQKILLVDDDRDILTIMEYCFEKMHDVVVKSVSSGEEALIEIPTFLPDLILLDVLMPRMNGITTYRALKKLAISHRVVVILVTARVQKHEIEQYIKEGIAEVIIKPFDPLTFASHVQTIWEKHKGN